MMGPLSGIGRDMDPSVGIDIRRKIANDEDSGAGVGGVAQEGVEAVSGDRFAVLSTEARCELVGPVETIKGALS